MNNYAEQLGYTNGLDLLFDFYKIEDLQNFIQMIFYHCSATAELDEIVNEMVGELVDGNANLKADVVVWFVRDLDVLI